MTTRGLLEKVERVLIDYAYGLTVFDNRGILQVLRVLRTFDKNEKKNTEKPLLASGFFLSICQLLTDTLQAWYTDSSESGLTI